jgi:outer membrane protein assembly complex protein YaeT
MAASRSAATIALALALTVNAWGGAAGAKSPGAKDSVPVKLEGAAAFSPKEILESVGVKTSVLEWFMRRPPRAERADLDAIAEAVRVFYQRHGYFEATVVTQSSSGGEVLLRVSEGPPCRVKVVIVSLAPGVPPGEADVEVLRRDLPIPEGQVFSADHYEAAEVLLRERMGEDGRAFAEVRPEAVVDLASHDVSVTYSVNPGARYTVGEIEFKGRKRSEERVLRRAMAIGTGDLYRQSKIDESRDHLYQLGLFETVTIKPVKGETRSVVNLRVRLTEGTLHRVRVGLGYGSEESLRAQVRWETLRFASHTMVVGAEAKVSAIDDKLETYLRRPYTFDARTSFLCSLTLGRKVEQDFDYNYLKAQAGYQRELVPGRLLGNAFLVFERVLQFTPNQSLDDALKGGARQVASMGSIAASMTYRTTDAPLEPTRGLLASLYLEPTQVLDQGGIFFTKAIGEGRLYLPLRPGWVVAFRLKVGAIFAGNPEGVPLTRRFYAGGANSVRGYSYNSLGPLSPQGALVGGDGLLEGSIELRFPIRGSLRGVAFLDAGNAVPRASSLPPDWLRAGTGVGVRYATPVGPIGLDLAWRLKHDALNPSPYQVYFFIGYAF